MLRSVLVLAALAALFAAGLVSALVLLRPRGRPRRSRLVEPEERADRAALRLLRETALLLDEDEAPARAREVTFYLYFATRAAADRAAAQAALLRVDVSSLAVRVEPAARGATWLCLVSAQLVPSEHAIRHACADLRAIAKGCGGEFDGWEAALPW